MVKQKFPCKNHPEKKSAKRCFVCKDYICSLCQNIWSHHVFCSLYCYIKFQTIEYKKFIRSNLKIITLFLIFQMITLVLAIILNSNKNQSISVSLNKDHLNDINSDTLTTFVVDTNSIPNSNLLMLYGEASNNSLLGLWQNGKFLQSKISLEENYKFEPLKLAQGKNIIKIVSVNPDGETTIVDSIVINFNSARLNELMNSVSKISTNKLALSLTFDAGSIITGADSILSILDRFNVNTTFFLTGQFIVKNPELTKSIVMAGHEVGNHMYSHPHLTQFENTNFHQTLEGVNSDFVQMELLKTDSVFFKTCGQNIKKYWRAPYGEYNKDILQWAAALGYRHIRWSKKGDLLDWVADENSPFYRTTDDMFNSIMELDQQGILKGSILLMHLGTNRTSSFPYKMLPKLISQLQYKNYKFMKISDLLNLRYSS